MLKSIGMLLLLMALPLSAAEVYKSVDQYGNTVFSDVPSDNAEKIDVGEVPTIPAVEEQAPLQSSPKLLPHYRTLELSSPVHDQTYFRSEGDLLVSIRLIPRLASNHTVVVYLNSNEFLSGRSLSYSIPELDRGTYQLRVAIKDGEGKILISSETITFHMRQASALNSNISRPASP